MMDYYLTFDIQNSFVHYINSLKLNLLINVIKRKDSRRSGRDLLPGPVTWVVNCRGGTRQPV